MKIKTNIKHLIIVLLNSIRERKKWILALSCLVVFFTTYLLILPAFTLDKEEASEQGGIDIPVVEQSAEAEETAEEPAESTSEDIEKEESVEETSKDVEKEEPAKPASEKSEKSSKTENKKSDTKKKATDITLENDESDDFSVAIESKDSVLSEDMSVAVREIDRNNKKQKKEYESLYSDALEAVQKAQKEEGLEKPSDFAFAKFYDISLMDGDIEVEPDAAVDVKISFSKDLQKELKVADSERVQIVHFAVNKKSGKVTPEVLDADTTDITVKNNKVTEASFTADSFSVFAVVYTVDFHYDIDGKQYDFSMDGGGFISLKALIEALKVNENAEEFIANVEKVEFSNPDLVWVGKAENDTTVGELKEKNGLEPEYSADLTKSQIAENDAQTVETGDWALISLKPFETEESLTVTMNTGDRFVVTVTDAQISRDFITAEGKTYTITVSYDDTAEIPDGADLNVREIPAGTKEYEDYLRDSAAELSVDSSEISFARFFDIEIVKDGEKIEPAKPVQVNIAYNEPVEIDLGEDLSIVHFADKETEIINELELNDGLNKITYMQDSFSVTGTVVTAPRQDRAYMVLVKTTIEEQDVYCIVNNDGTLTPVNDVDLNQNGSVRNVYVTDPMLWTYTADRHLYHNYDALHYNELKAADAFYYRYLNPADASGVSTENSSNTHYINQNNIRRDLYGSTQINYDASTHLLRNGSNYAGITVDEEGTLRLSGQKNAQNAVEVYFAEAANVKDPKATNNTVNHIDISMAGKSVIDVPLAYGNYYDENGQLVMTVSEDHKVTIEATSDVDITVDNMKKATITAYQIDANGNEVPLDDAFYITGYSRNNPTEFGDKQPQVRMEGSFLTAKAMNGEDLNQYDWATGTYKNRLNNRVYYTVQVTKPVPFDLKDENGTQLYDADGEKMTITIDVTMAATFNYWDPDNNCPPVQEWIPWYGGGYWNNREGHAEWLRGGYPGQFGDISGMDFILGGDADDTTNNVVALEITKLIVDENGNLIHPDTPVTNTFQIYRKGGDLLNKDGIANSVKDINVDSYKGQETEELYAGYSSLHYKTIKVGEEGMGLVYDYAVTPGMYYITENHDEDSLPRSITDTADQDWTYKETRILTEYVRRGDQYDDKSTYKDPMHYSATYSSENDAYRAIPEVLGRFKRLDDTEKKSGFVEFFVYNVYEPVITTTDVTLKKVDAEELSSDSADPLKGATFTLTKYTDNTFSHVDTSNPFTQTQADVQDATTGDYNLNGIFQFTELPVGFYRIDETVTPSGYVKTVDDLVFEVRQKTGANELEVVLYEKKGETFSEATDGTTDMMRLASDNFTIIVGNPPGVELPHTGGIGTIIFYIFGAVLTLGSAVLLVSRKCIQKKS